MALLKYYNAIIASFFPYQPNFSVYFLMKTFSNLSSIYASILIILLCDMENESGRQQAYFITMA